MIRVAIADDHPEMKLALRLLLKLSEEMKLVVEMSSGRDALNCIPSLRPDVLVMDIRLPEMNGLEASRQIISLGIKTRVILMSSSGGSLIVRQAIEAGAMGFVPKDDVAALLLVAVEKVYRGETFFVE